MVSKEVNSMYLVGRKTYRAICFMTFSGAGFVLLTPDFHVLLIQDAKTLKWGFPKGHRESTDTSDLHTAQREVHEETGIRPEDYYVHEEPFRILKGSSSYIFRYAFTQTPIGSVQNRREISQLMWVSLPSLLLHKDVYDGNKYLRTWIDDIVNNIPKKSVTTMNLLLQTFALLQQSQSQSSQSSHSWLELTVKAKAAAEHGRPNGV